MQDEQQTGGLQPQEPATDATTPANKHENDNTHVVFDEETFQGQNTDQQEQPQKPPTDQDSGGHAAETVFDGIVKEGMNGTAAFFKAAANNKETKPATLPPAPKQKSRETKTVSFNLEEFAYADAVVYARIKSGITDDWNHFLRQCVDFAINNEFAEKGLQGMYFARPNIPRLHLKNAFFQPKK